jgi:hypothetical protein
MYGTRRNRCCWLRVVLAVATQLSGEGRRVTPESCDARDARCDELASAACGCRTIAQTKARTDRPFKMIIVGKRKEEINSPYEGWDGMSDITFCVLPTQMSIIQTNKIEVSSWGWCTGTFRLRVVNKVASASRGRSECSQERKGKKKSSSRSRSRTDG